MNRISLVLPSDHVVNILKAFDIPSTGNSDFDSVTASEKLGEFLRKQCGLTIDNGYVEYGQLCNPKGWQDDSDGSNALTCPHVIVFWEPSLLSEPKINPIEWLKTCDLILLHQALYSEIRLTIKQATDPMEKGCPRLAIFGAGYPSAIEIQAYQRYELLIFETPTGTLVDQMEQAVGELKQNLERRRLLAPGHIVIADDQIKELDKLDWIFRKTLMTLSDSHPDLADMCIHGVLCSEEGLDIKSFERRLETYGQTRKPFLLFLDYYMNQDLSKTVFDQIKELAGEHPELEMMVFTGENGFGKRLNELTSSRQVRYGKKPHNNTSMEFNNDLLRMIERSRKSMEIWAKIRQVQTILSPDFKYEVEKVGKKNEPFYISSSALKETLKRLDLAGETREWVFLIGASGTGKDLLAKYYWSKHFKSKPFFKYDCARSEGTDANIVRAEFFGTTSGAFTGSVQKDGLIKAAKDGVLFLDEVQGLRPEFQTELNSFLDDLKYTAVGSTIPESSSVVLVAATNVPAGELKLNNDFRQRLERVVINLSPLSHRLEDACAVLVGLTRDLRNQLAQQVWTLPALYLMAVTDWPGDIRQLKNRTEDLLNAPLNRISVSDVANKLRLNGHPVDEQLLYHCQQLESVEHGVLKDGDPATVPEKAVWIQTQLKRIEKRVKNETTIPDLWQMLKQEGLVETVLPDNFIPLAIKITKCCAKNPKRWTAFRKYFGAPGREEIRNDLKPNYSEQWLDELETTLRCQLPDYFSRNEWKKFCSSPDNLWKKFVWNGLLGLNHNNKNPTILFAFNRPAQR